MESSEANKNYDSIDTLGNDAINALPLSYSVLGNADTNLKLHIGTNDNDSDILT